MEGLNFKNMNRLNPTMDVAELARRFVEDGVLEHEEYKAWKNIFDSRRFIDGSKLKEYLRESKEEK
jgi:hypothetical protein